MNKNKGKAFFSFRKSTERKSTEQKMFRKQAQKTAFQTRNSSILHVHKVDMEKLSVSSLFMRTLKHGRQMALNQSFVQQTAVFSLKY